MPRSSRMSNSFLASSSRSGGNRRGLAKTGGPCVRMWCCIEWVAGILVLKQDVMIRSVLQTTDNFCIAGLDESVREGPRRHVYQALMLQVDEQVKVPKEVCTKDGLCD
ncbi:hypothetical protein T07_11371, partial [Trichinella nelsoni]